MNYLAHLALSPADPDIMLGNFLADSVRPVHVKSWSVGIQEGYQLHMDIDRYTDAHPSFKRAVVKLRAHHKKYAPVVLDILNDHLLAKHWMRHEKVDFELWCDEIYKKLDLYKALELPPKAQKLYNGLVEHRYLHVYQSKEGITNVLGRMDKRARFDSNFVRGAEDLYADLTFYEDTFHELYTDLNKRF